MKWYHFLVLFFEGFIFSLFLTPLMRRVAPRLGFLDHPGERKVHIQPKPLLGGAAIFFSILLVVFLDLFLLNWIGKSDFASNNQIFKELNLLSFWAAGYVNILHQLSGFFFFFAILFCIGLVDDCYGMNPVVKLCG